MPVRKNLTGMRFGRLVAVCECGRNDRNLVLWLCNCDCGNTKIVVTSSLFVGMTKSCGCYSKDYPSHRKHGGRGTRLYQIWKSMRERCSSVKNEDSKNYSERGISICKEWDDFSVFREWANNNGYADHLSIDRINNDGNYEPNNCRWATWKQQARNTRRNLLYCIKGEVKCFAEWCEIYGVNYKAAHQRLKKGKQPFPETGLISNG